jgi:hypothetical protein
MANVWTMARWYPSAHSDSRLALILVAAIGKGRGNQWIEPGGVECKPHRHGIGGDTGEPPSK